MVAAFKITNEMKNTRQSKVDEIVERVNQGIQRAVSQNRNETYFSCDKDSYSDGPFYDEVRRIFERAGYKIVPTGYIGGVWQRTEHIRW